MQRAGSAGRASAAGGGPRRGRTGWRVGARGLVDVLLGAGAHVRDGLALRRGQAHHRPAEARMPLYGGVNRRLFSGAAHEPRRLIQASLALAERKRQPARVAASGAGVPPEPRSTATPRAQRRPVPSAGPPAPVWASTLLSRRRLPGAPPPTAFPWPEHARPLHVGLCVRRRAR